MAGRRYAVRFIDKDGRSLCGDGYVVVDRVPALGETIELKRVVAGDSNEHVWSYWTVARIVVGFQSVTDGINEGWCESIESIRVFLVPESAAETLKWTD
jgi:hypothetical protein